MYNLVLLNDRKPLADILGGPAMYVSTHGALSGWHFDAHWLPALNFHWGGGPALW
jgi:hypothetical protein